MKNKTVYNMVLAAMFFAIGLLLPFLTGQIPEIGGMLLPMHLPVLLCGLICGWKYGGVVGFSLPLLRSLIFGMPPLYPKAIAMSAELMIYGLVVGILYMLSKKKNIIHLYVSLISAMILGRVAWGIATMILLGIKGNKLTFISFISSTVLEAVPGIIIQLVLIPIIMLALKRSSMKL